MRFPPSVVALTALLPMAASAADPRAGILVVGPDSAAVSAAQTAIEGKVAAVPATVRGTADLAPAMAGPVAATANAWSNDPAARAAFDAALADAKRSYFSDLMPQATAKLDEAAAVLERALDVPGTIRVKVPLWRAAVALRQNQKDAAASEVNVALLLVPNLELEPNSPPPVVQLLADSRAKSPKPFKVQLHGVPANATVKIDDVVLAASAIAVLPGPHVLDVIAPGYRPFNQSFDAAADSTVNVVLVRAFAPAWEKMFDAIVERAEVADTEKKSLESLAARDKLDFIVIAAVKPGETKGVVWRRSDGVTQSGSAAEAGAFGAWAASQLAPKAVAMVPVATPKPAATPAPSGTPAAVPTPAHGDAQAGKFQVAAEAGLGFVRWDRTVEADGGEGYSVPGLTGGGPRLRVRAGKARGPIAAVEASYFTFGTMKTKDRQGDAVSVPGGSMLSARFGAGWRFVFGQNIERALSITPSLGGFYESHAAQDLAGEDVFPSHTRTGADVRLAAGIPAGPVSIVLEGGVTPFSTWTEDPDGVTGEDPKTAAGPLFRLGVDMPVGGKGRVALDWSGEMRSVQYSEQGTSGLDLVDAKRDELLSVLGLSFRYRF